MICRSLPLAAALFCLGLTAAAAAQPSAAQPAQSPAPAQPGPAAPVADAAMPSCNVVTGWWESPHLNPIFPANKQGGPDDCDFQVWSWTAFVHWMQTDPKTGSPLFLELPTPDDLNSGDPLRTTVGPRTLTLKPRTQKPKTIGEFEQAGSNGVLVDQNGRAVYYATHLDPVYFGTTQQYYGPANYAKASPTTQYPVNATVFKTAWRIVPPGEVVDDAFVTKATISLLESDGKGGLRTNGLTQNDVTVALVGVHVVGVVADHPEFLWATFEHVRNAPNLPYGLSPTSTEPVSDKNYTFYKANTPAAASNRQAKGSLSIDPATQVIAPVTNVFRQFQYGGASPAQRIVDIVQSNRNFRQHIAGGSRSSSIAPVFAGYNLHGTVWILAGTLQPGDGNLDLQSIGSLDLASSVMETFVQGKGTNCFSCHNTSGGSNYAGKDVNFSHMLLNSLKPNAAILQAR